MAFTFLHTADWHIGRTFGSFEASHQSILRRARLGTIDRLAEAALVNGAAHAVVCGDVFDGPGLADEQLLATLARLSAHDAITWHLLPGNHDPARADGIWSRLAKLGLPKNVQVLLSPTPVMIAPGVVLLPAPLLSKAVSGDPTGWMDAASTPPGHIRIGVAHGSTQGFGSADASNGTIAPARRQSARLDYLALGDWHGVREIADGVWYSGAPEPEDFPNNEPGFALIVTIDGAGASPRVQKVATAAHTWMKRAYTVSRADDLAALEDEIAGFGPAKSNLLLELTLTGAVSLADDAVIAARIAALEPALFHLRRKFAGLRINPASDDLTSLADPQLAAVAQQLMALRYTPERADNADGALRRLYSLARQAEGQSA